ncbi:MAG: glutathione synthase [Deltaproteobacteria bacterium]|nr:glutathione synthase [Deltaproteobacteria bacterium]
MRFLWEGAWGNPKKRLPHDKKTILSFHPLIVGHENRLCAGREPTGDDVEAVQAADAVILPQGFYPVWAEVFRRAKAAFPEYGVRFSHPGKTGQARLFSELGLPVPKTFSFSRAKEADLSRPPLSYPFVFKTDTGGEGCGVRLVQDEQGFSRALALAGQEEAAGRPGFLLQEYVPHGGRTLRVAVVGEHLEAYWKTAPKGDFKSSVAGGGRIERRADPHLMKGGVAAARAFCQRTGVNLAGLDFIFREGGAGPLFLEINWFFGRRGLGGSQRFYGLLHEAVAKWLARRGLRLPG